MPPLRWDPTVNFLGLLTFVGLLFTIMGLIFTGLGIRQNTRIQRARFLWETVNAFFSDSEIQQAYSLVEWGKFSFDPDTIPTSPNEQYLDRLLYTLDAVGYLCKMGALPLKDVQQVLGFRILVVMSNPEVQKYLAFLEETYQAKGAPQRPHRDARWLVGTLRPTTPIKARL